MGDTQPLSNGYSILYNISQAEIYFSGDKREGLHWSVPFILEQAKVVFVLEPVTEGVALAQVSFF